MSDSSPILFFYPWGNWGWMSNLFESSIYLDGQTWDTVEHYYQSKKFNISSSNEASKEYSKVIASVHSPYDAKYLAYQNTKYAPENLHDTIEIYKDLGANIEKDEWARNRDQFMFNALLAKFSQNSYLRSALKSTEGRMIIFESSDMYWGVGQKCKGKNCLGKLLEYIRTIL